MAVTTDVVSDMRVRKVCEFLSSNNSEVVVVGRKMPDTFELQLPFKVKLINMLFHRNAFFLC